MAEPVSVSAVLIGIILVNSVLGIFPNITDLQHYYFYYIYPTHLPDPPDLINLRWFNIIDKDTYLSSMRKHGYSEEWAEALYESSKNILPVIDIINAWRRGIISTQMRDELLTYQKVPPELTDLVVKVSEYYPSPTDLVRFAVREVYSPEIASRYGLYEDLPEVFLQKAKEAGLSEEFAKAYWASHWELPSLTMGFEMFHRGIISLEELKTLMRTQDIMPFWRDRLIQLSYEPLTRVDVRRMYALGVLSFDEMIQAYQDLGYSPENARRLAEFTKRYESNENTGITRSAVIKAYKDDLIDISELKDFLERLEYPPDVVNFWLEVAEYEKQTEDLKHQVDELVSQYRLGLINLDTLRDKLTALNLPASYINSIINKEIISESKKVKLPTPEDLKQWLKLQIIDESSFYERMRDLGYREQDIRNYLSEFALAQDTSKVKYLPIQTYLRWLTKGIIDQEEFISIGKNLGYTEEDLTRLIIEASGGE